MSTNEKIKIVIALLEDALDYDDECIGMSADRRARLGDILLRLKAEEGDSQ